MRGSQREVEVALALCAARGLQGGVAVRLVWWCGWCGGAAGAAAEGRQEGMARRGRLAWAKPMRHMSSSMLKRAMSRMISITARMNGPVRGGREGG